MRVKILDGDGNELPRGEIGGVYLEPERGRSFAYKDDPELTKSVSKGRAFTLGDIGLLDEDGYLFIRDRAKDMIISGGVNIFPAEVEGVLSGHPSVGDVAVIGIPTRNGGAGQGDRRAGGRSGAERRVGRGAGLLPPGTDGPLQVPRTVDFREELPCTDGGKLYKRVFARGILGRRRAQGVI